MPLLFLNKLLSILVLCYITMTTSLSPPNEIRVAFLGNSILYFNDCPRLVEHMLKTNFSKVHQDSCLRGGASLPSLWKDGNGMRSQFGHSENAKKDDGSVDIGAATVQKLLQQNWHIVVMNDYTQAPVRPETRLATMEALDQLYGPLLQSTIPIFLQTVAYRKPVIKGTDDLGTVAGFTSRLKEGYNYYAKTLEKHTDDVRIAPAGEAFLWVNEHNEELWNQLFYIDDFHPSPHGTWLEACVLYCTMVGEAPPIFRPEWFETARYMQPPKEEQLPLPSAEEAEELRKTACVVCGISLQCKAV